MIFFKKKYFKEKLLLIMTCLLSTLLLYYFLLHKILTAYTMEKTQNTLLLHAFLQDCDLQKKDTGIQKQLRDISIKNNTLYESVENFKNSDQLSSTLSTLIEQAGFSIHSVQPVITNQNLHLQVSASGDYFALFRLINALENCGWPINLIGIQIEKHDQFNLAFLMQSAS